jgi:uncharacterized protein HemY
MQKKWAEAVASYREALSRKPDLAPAHNNLAWLFATCPEISMRDARQAVFHAGRAVELAPGDAGFWNTLGMARYRDGDWKGAITAVKKSMEIAKDSDASDCFILAMAHSQSGDARQAREWFDKAVAWMDNNKPKDEELLRSRAEAAELLGLREAETPKKNP